MKNPRGEAIVRLVPHHDLICCALVLQCVCPQLLGFPVVLMAWKLSKETRTSPLGKAEIDNESFFMRICSAEEEAILTSIYFDSAATASHQSTELFRPRHVPATRSRCRCHGTEPESKGDQAKRSSKHILNRAIQVSCLPAAYPRRFCMSTRAFLSLVPLLP